MANHSYSQPNPARALASVVIGVNDPNIFYMGRWTTGTIAGTKIFDWGGSVIRMTITGTTTLGISLQVCRQHGSGCA